MKLGMAKSSLRDLLRKKRTEKTRTEKKALSPEMRTLLASGFEPLDEHRGPQDGSRRSDQESQVSARR
jgi:hypothetical protein